MPMTTTHARTLDKPRSRLHALIAATAAATVLAVASLPAQAVEPFTADYQASYMGMQANGKMTLAPAGDDRWRYSLDISNSLASLSQSTVFDVAGETYRPLTQATVNKTIFTRKQTIGFYDWRSNAARWEGEVDEDHPGPIALETGDMTGLLINLALIRDAEPGKTLHYRFVDDGRTRQHTYVVADEIESLSVGNLSYKAMKATRAKDANEETVIWVARNVPTPIRILQRENGEDTYDLRLVEYRGVD